MQNNFNPLSQLSVGAQSCQLKSPAKLNLFLHITGQRVDGYHFLQSVFVPLALADMMDFELEPNGSIQCQNSNPDIPPQQDLIYRAAQLLKTTAQVSLGAKIKVKKNIPLGSGMGGGSSNAASTLLALNKLWQCQLTQNELIALATQLGADVPFFIQGQASFVEGVGEQLQTFPLSKSYEVLLIQPELSIKTAQIFQAPELQRDTPKVTLDEVLAQFEQKSSCNNLIPFGHNDLETVVLQQYPQLKAMKAWLNDLGYEPRMTGAGSTFFLLFDTVSAARVCYTLIQESIGAYYCKYAKQTVPLHFSLSQINSSD